MRLIISGGGTGGHIYPAIALINRLKERDLLDDVLYVGTNNGLERKIIEELNIPFQSIEIQGFKRKFSFENVKTINLFISSIFKSRKIIKEFKPDIIVGTGGYVSGSIVFAGSTMKIPTIIHEQNSVPGVTNKFLAKFVTKIAISFKEVEREFSQKEKIILTGNPRAQEVINIEKNDRLKEFGLDPSIPTVLIFGGSRGAKPLNIATIDSLKTLEQEKFQVLFATGKVHFDYVKNAIDINKFKNISIVPYINNMPEILPDIDLIVGRSGATSIAEITALGIPSIFVPSPYVTNDHQTKNAKILVDNGAAKIIKENQLNEKTLTQNINEIMNDKNLYYSMSKNSKKLGIPNASDLLIDEMVKLIK